MALRGSRLPWALLIALLVPLLAALVGCDAIRSSPAPSPTDEEIVVPERPARADAIACISIQPAECADVAERILALLPGALGNPFSIQVRLFGCPNDGQVCPPSLAVREGQVLVEYPDGGTARVFQVAGPPAAPALEPVEATVFTDPIQPGSPPAGGGGPFEFEVGHCGLLHVVDFNGSFWILVGEVDGAHQALYNAERGVIRLQGLESAQYVGTGNVIFQLERFPGAKRFQLCD